MKIFLVTALLLAAVSANPLLHDSVATIRNNNTDNYRLPNNSVPISYKIELIPHINEDYFTFDGESAIELRILEPSSSITLHSLDLTVHETSLSLVSSTNVSYKIANYTEDETKQFLILNFATDLPTGLYTLYLKYIGLLDDEILNGFYRSSYINENGETVWLATTQFEPTAARKAFPCWDEPALKATFTISIKHDVNYTALSNMPVASQSEIDETDNKLWTTFETTPIMSTYLVAFVVSDYGYVSNAEGTFRVWTRKNAINTTAYALTLGESELEYLQNYTMIPFALPKMDQISIPDFSAGAMENWGLVTYRETALLYQEGVTSLSSKQSIATVISHEFAHQWFGNLVSPAWWKYLWLNEGFATYFQYYTTDEAEDNWDLMEQFVVRVVQATAFVADSSATTHPLNQDASTPNEISSLFDTICYNKGAAVIRMMSHFLTSNGFRTGLTRYLNDNAYGVATTDDLWTALQEVSDEMRVLQTHVYVKTVMDTWVEQPGYPVVTVIRNYTTETAVISQERYFQSGAGDDGTRWWVPISYTTEFSQDFSSTLAKEWIRQQDDSIIVGIFKSIHWLIVNVQQSGYYRVNYDETNWKLLADYLNSMYYITIHRLNRAQLIDDSYNLARSNRISFSIFLDITVYLKYETDYIPWYPGMVAISQLYPKLADTKSFPLFRKYFAERLGQSLFFLGYDEKEYEKHVHKFHRINTINWACSLGHEICRSVATSKLVAYLENSTANPISTEFTAWTYCAGLRSANVTVWDKVLDLYIESRSTSILNYLGCSEDEEILDQYLTYATTRDSDIFYYDAYYAYASVYNGSPQNINFALDYFINEFERISTFWSSSVQTLQMILAELGSKITTREQLQKLKDLIARENDLFGSVGSSVIAKAESNVQWTDTYEPVFREWFYKFYGLGNEQTSSTTSSPDHTEPAVTTESPDDNGNSAASVRSFNFILIPLTIASVQIFQSRIY
ncbi:aminopeptidase N [Cephus cinctus]|uniref:Aminopeptidase n=1 Tax=Cephus cinctus TaxID=211228 RepID=A0AAJ7C9U5_CEPCN|nr:aminopeptidase N [Cephus cinctus]